MLILLGVIVGAAGGMLAMLRRQKKLRSQAYLSADRVYDGTSQPNSTLSEVSCSSYVLGMHCCILQTSGQGCRFAGIYTMCFRIANIVL